MYRLGTRPKIQCSACRHQTSLTAGTIFHATKLALTSWFLAIWLVATAKNGISSVELGRRLGIKQTNAWVLKQKIMAVMAAREDNKPLWAGSRWTTPIWAAIAAASAAAGLPASSPLSPPSPPATSAGRAR